MVQTDVDVTISFRLYEGKHWNLSPEWLASCYSRNRAAKRIKKRILRQDIKEWLEALKINYRFNPGDGRKPTILIKDYRHATLFKLTWM